MKKLAIALLAVLGLVVGLLIALYAYATTLPETHTASVTAMIPAPPDEVRARVEDWRDPSWKEGVTAVEDLGIVDGRQRFRECTWECLDFEVVPGGEGYRTRVVDNPDFGGTWTWRFEPVDGGTRVTLTEDGEVYSPVFRLFMVHVFGTDGTIREVMGALERSW